MNIFTKRKQDCLSKKDKSSIGSFDEKIAGLCEKINKLDNYYTLSSCSGRIVIIKDKVEKEPGMFVLRNHSKVGVGDLKKALETYSGKDNLIFKMEPCILHVACRSLEDAEFMLNLARQCGWKNSGVMSFADSRIVLEMRSTESFALPIFEKGKILVDNKYLEILAAESNKKIEKTWGKIDFLEKKL